MKQVNSAFNIMKTIILSALLLAIVLFVTLVVYFATCEPIKVATDKEILPQITEVKSSEQPAEEMKAAGEDDLGEENSTQTEESIDNESVEKNNASTEPQVEDKADSNGAENTPEINEEQKVEDVLIPEAEQKHQTSNQLTAWTLVVDGAHIPYVDALGQGSAPSTGAGIWRGNDSVSDGELCYFMGHNPGDFSVVMNLKIDSKVTVCDRNGNTKTYSVVDVFDVSRESHWSDIANRVEGYGESIALQTCNDSTYRIVVCI